RYKKGTWDGKRHLFNTKKCMFPSGLSHRVAKIVKDSGVEGDINWPEDPAGEKLEFASAGKPVASRGKKKTAAAKADVAGTDLREYREKCVTTALEGRRGVIEIATGGGKTVIAAHLIRRIARPTLFLVHTRDLMHQTIAVFKRELNIPVGQAGDGVIELRQVTVATLQTCARVMDIKIVQPPVDDEPLESDKTDVASRIADLQEFITSVPVVFFDECHHLPADTAYGLAMEMENAVWRYGLSATPYRADRQDMLMEAALGPKLFSARASTLIDLGYLVPPHIKFLPVPQLAVKAGKTDYQDI